MGKYFSFGQNTTLTGNLLINNYYVVVIAYSTWLWNMELMKLNWKQVKLSFSMECRGWNNVRNAWGSEQIPSPKIEFPILNTISFSVRVRKFFAAAVFIVTNTVPSIFSFIQKLSCDWGLLTPLALSFSADVFNTKDEHFWCHF